MMRSTTWRGQILHFPSDDSSEIAVETEETAEVAGLQANPDSYSSGDSMQHSCRCFCGSGIKQGTPPPRSPRSTPVWAIAGKDQPAGEISVADWKDGDATEVQAFTGILILALWDVWDKCIDEQLIPF